MVLEGCSIVCVCDATTCVCETIFGVSVSLFRRTFFNGEKLLFHDLFFLREFTGDLGDIFE